ncbi:uncharacterized protein PRCAT00002594001 [Priceomyces carsonii]|uniref:uncharacterized protein n=1 Tax=Priceomyces carsonii TaxID=28549 RepID=UPI002ED77F1F|nr:unnamed protein product [Priceomyces carsonii]
MAKEKRTKPCSNCKKSKVKCIYSNSLPCERCIKLGQAVSCQFVPKLPSLKLPLITTSHSDSTHIQQSLDDIGLPPLKPLLRSSDQSEQQSQEPRHPGNLMGKLQQGPDIQWKQLVEQRITSFDSKISDLVELLKTNQKVLMEGYKGQAAPHHLANDYQENSSQYPGHLQIRLAREGISEGDSFQQGIEKGTDLKQDQELHHHHHHYHHHHHQDQFENIQDRIPWSNQLLRIQDSTSNNSDGKRQNLTVYEKDHRAKLRRLDSDNLEDSSVDDFRMGFLDKAEAHELFAFFEEYISPQLFGFEISKFSVDNLWETSPILICAICAISSMHHPNKQLSQKSKGLHKYLRNFCGTLLFKGRPNNEVDGFNTIVALVLCSFWLTDSQMFTGLALQLAKEIGLDSPQRSSAKSSLSAKERMKLWYLLFILDGQQSLTFNRSPLVNSQDYSLKHSREILLSKKKTSPAINGKENEPDDKEVSENIQSNEHFSDMRLVSQVEYNQALNEAFKGDAWDLLTPSSFGIPSKSNLELDKWMVSWTVLLASENNGSVWSSKSTLIYYNFAKMHINSKAVRDLGLDITESNMFPKWSNHLCSTSSKTKVIESTEESDSDDTSDEEFISNKELVSDNEKVVSAIIAINAAQTVINLVLSDEDILNNLKYVPVHIHIMLYYAALLLINPPSDSINKSVSFTEEKYYDQLITNLKIVKSLQKKIYTNLPTDRNFGDRLIMNLNNIVEEKLSKIRTVLDNPNTDIPKSKSDSFRERLSVIGKDNSQCETIELLELESHSLRSSSPEKFSAWPGSHHGHP